MKCPYCAEEIRDEAIKCRFCGATMTKEIKLAVRLGYPHFYKNVSQWGGLRVEPLIMDYGEFLYQDNGFSDCYLEVPCFFSGALSGNYASRKKVIAFIEAMSNRRSEIPDDCQEALVLDVLIRFIVLSTCVYPNNPNNFVQSVRDTLASLNELMESLSTMIADTSRKDLVQKIDYAIRACECEVERVNVTLSIDQIIVLRKRRNKYIGLGVGLSVIIYIIVTSVIFSVEKKNDKHAQSTPNQKESNLPSPTYRELSFPQRYVEDRANIISDAVEKDLNGHLRELEQKTDAQMIVLTVNTTGSIPIETYAVEFAAEWKLGQKGKEIDVLIVIAKDDRAYRTEVGYGLEGILPDNFCGTIGRKYFVPNFKKGHFSEGIYQGVLTIGNKIVEDLKISTAADRLFIVKVLSSPSGATVLFDKKQVGITPLSMTLKNGAYGIGVKKDGYESVHDMIEVKEGGNREFNFKLEEE